MGRAQTKAAVKPAIKTPNAGLTLLPSSAPDSPLSQAKSHNRFLWIDAFRGVAVIAMILFHACFDLHTFGQGLIGGPLPVPPQFWQIIPMFIGSTFLSLAGISAAIREHRDENFAHFLLCRGSRIIGLAALISMVTVLLISTTPIYFGILHCIGLSLLLLLGLRKISPRLLLGLGVTILLTGAWLWQLRFSTYAWLWLGIRPEGNAGWDYYPILPWSGFLVCAYALTKMLQKKAAASEQATVQLLSAPIFKPLLFLGRNSLVIYFLHQPILLAILWLATSLVL